MKLLLLAISLATALPCQVGYWLPSWHQLGSVNTGVEPSTEPGEQHLFGFASTTPTQGSILMRTHARRLGNPVGSCSGDVWYDVGEYQAFLVISFPASQWTLAGAEPFFDQAWWDPASVTTVWPTAWIGSDLGYARWPSPCSTSETLDYFDHTFTYPRPAGIGVNLTFQAGRFTDGWWWLSNPVSGVTP